MPSKILILHSGGLDSTVCLYKAVALKNEVISLGIEYNQRHHIELEYAEKQCVKLGVPRKVIKVKWDKPIRPLPTNRNVETIKSSVSPAFLPGRNAVFFALAAAEASGLGCDEIWTGINAVDFSGYPDCKPMFFEAFKLMINQAIPGGPRFIAPLLYLSKPEIARLAKELKIGRQDTWSCYNPQKTPEGYIECGKCDACTLNEFAWQHCDAQKNAYFKAS
jgi:7-cyano-7-deazaguanine synthase